MEKMKFPEESERKGYTVIPLLPEMNECPPTKGDHFKNGNACFPFQGLETGSLGSVFPWCFRLGSSIRSQRRAASGRAFRHGLAIAVGSAALLVGDRTGGGQGKIQHKSL